MHFIRRFIVRPSAVMLGMALAAGAQATSGPVASRSAAAVTTNQFVNGTNSIYGNLANQISATNSATLLNINSASNVNFSYASGISNFLISAKQPGSLVLSNLAATGAITNILASGINMALTTNISGNTIIFNATNQTFLTNNLASTNFVLASIASSNAGFATLQNISSSNTAALQTTTNLILAFK